MVPLDDDELESFHRFWDDIIYINGRMSEAQVTLELYDYMRMVVEVPVVYDYITGGLISKPNAHAASVIQAADRYIETMIKDAALEVLRRAYNGEPLTEIAKDFSNGQ